MATLLNYKSPLIPAQQKLKRGARLAGYSVSRNDSIVVVPQLQTICYSQSSANNSNFDKPFCGGVNSRGAL
jgi:hypothetical protein